jgi:hypothetical protein
VPPTQLRPMRASDRGAVRSTPGNVGVWDRGAVLGDLTVSCVTVTKTRCFSMESYSVCRTRAEAQILYKCSDARLRSEDPVLGCSALFLGQEFNTS